MGNNIGNRLASDWQSVAALYQDYLLCRQTQFFVFRKPTGKSDGSERLVTVIWPTGFSSWPQPGGLNDQGYLTVRLFGAFLRGEQRGQIRLMQRNR